MSKPRSLFIFVLIAAVVSLLPACGNNKPFDSAAWLKANPRDRGRMAEDLVNNKVLLGQPLDQAKLLLGEPEKDWGRVIQYQIDLGWPFKDPKHYGLQVHLDEKRYVREVRIVD